MDIKRTWVKRGITKMINDLIAAGRKLREKSR